MSFPYPGLLTSLENDKERLDFMKVVAEVGLGSGDIELAKLLKALQLYKAYYAAMPRQIKAVHEEALADIRRIRDEAETICNRAASDTVQIGQWAEEIHRSLQATEPAKLAADVQKRLVAETLSLLGGSVQAIGAASRQIETATNNMNEAAYRAVVCIDYWQAVSLRRVWACAFGSCLIAVVFLLGCFWFVFLRHQTWWLSLQ